MEVRIPYRMVRTAVACCLLASAIPAPAAARQQPPAELLATVDSVYYAGAVEQALDLLDEAGDARGAGWRVIRCMIALSMQAPSDTERDHWLARAVGNADALLENGPLNTEDLYWVAAAEGLRSLNTGAREAGDLGLRAQNHAQLILAVDSLHGGAHNILGRVNFEVMVLPRAKRVIGRVILGGRFPRNVSWEGAEFHLRRATELWPHMMRFHLDLAWFFERRGRTQEARAAAMRALETPALHPPDPLFQDQARALIHRLDALPPRSP